MNNGDINSIFEQINNLKKPVTEQTETKPEASETALREVLNSVSEEIQRVLDENNFTQEDLCRITNMSQSNISKIQNGKVVIDPKKCISCGTCAAVCPVGAPEAK